MAGIYNNFPKKEDCSTQRIESQHWSKIAVFCFRRRSGFFGQTKKKAWAVWEKIPVLWWRPLMHSWNSRCRARYTGEDSSSAWSQTKTNPFMPFWSFSCKRRYLASRLVKRRLRASPLLCPSLVCGERKKKHINSWTGIWYRAPRFFLPLDSSDITLPHTVCLQRRLEAFS